MLAKIPGLLDAIGGHWAVDPGAEVTLEANPTSVEATRFQGYRAAGINRVSLGVQALNDPDLKALGRLHSAEEALAAVEIAARHFERFSFDLIYARPGQTAAAWKAELHGAIDRADTVFAPSHCTHACGTRTRRSSPASASPTCTVSVSVSVSRPSTWVAPAGSVSITSAGTSPRPVIGRNSGWATVASPSATVTTRRRMPRPSGPRTLPASGRCRSTTR